MPYCTITEIKTEAPHLTITSTSDPTETEVTAIMSEISTGEMDTKLRSVLTLPITDVQGLRYLKRIAIYGTLATVYRLLGEKAERVEQYDTLYRNGLEWILLNPTAIEVSPPTSPGSGSITTGLITRDTKFPRGENQW